MAALIGDVLTVIVSFCSDKDIVAILPLVSKRWENGILCTEEVWERFRTQGFPYVLVGNDEGNDNASLFCPMVSLVRRKRELQALHAAEIREDSKVQLDGGSSQLVPQPWNPVLTSTQDLPLPVRSALEETHGIQPEEQHAVLPLFFQQNLKIGLDIGSTSKIVLVALLTRCVWCHNCPAASQSCVRGLLVAESRDAAIEYAETLSSLASQQSQHQRPIVVALTDEENTLEEGVPYLVAGTAEDIIKRPYLFNQVSTVAVLNLNGEYLPNTHLSALMKELHNSSSPFEESAGEEEGGEEDHSLTSRCQRDFLISSFDFKNPNVLEFFELEVCKESKAIDQYQSTHNTVSDPFQELFDCHVSGFQLFVHPYDLLRHVQNYYVDCVEPQFKLETLVDLLQCMTSQVIVCCNSDTTVDKLVKDLTRLLDDGDNADEQQEQVDLRIAQGVHSRMGYKERGAALNAFRSGDIMVLVVRGDLPAFRQEGMSGVFGNQITRTIHYDLPRSEEEFVTRVGRHGKFGRKGTSIALVCSTQKAEDVAVLRKIQDHTEISFDELPADFSSVM